MICVKCGKEVAEAPYCGECGWKQANAPQKRSKRGNGQGRVWKRGSSWYCQVTLYAVTEIVDGKKKYHQKRRTKGGFATKRDALAYIETLRAPESRRIPTVLDLYSQWEKTDYPKLSESKKSAYKKARERIDSIMGRKIDTLTVAELQTLTDEKSSSFYTARDIKSLLSHIYKKALPDRFVPDNLAQYIVLPELHEKESKPFTADEVQKIWEAFAGGDTFSGYMLLMIYTGMMPGELFACRKDMIDYERHEIYGCGKKTKTRKEVPIVFPDTIAPVIEALCGYSPSDKLQPHAEDNWYAKYHECISRIGIRDLPPYSCRHTTGTEAARLNLSAPIIQSIMRHAKITTTQQYIHLGADTTLAAVNQLPGKAENSNPVANT